MEGYFIRLDGTNSYGTFDSTVAFGTASDDITFRYRFTGTAGSAPTGDVWLFGGDTGNDGILVKRGTTKEMQVRINGTYYDSNDITDEFFDGDEHDVRIYRDSGDLIIDVDGAELCRVTVPATDVNIDYLMSNIGASGTRLNCWIGELVVAGSTYRFEPRDFGSTTLVDTSVSGNDIALTSIDWGLLSKWEWTSELTAIDREVYAASITAEKRLEGVRTRIVRGFEMRDPLILQVGDQLSEVLAYNGSLESGLVGVFGAAQQNQKCEEEKAIPIHGAPFFRQSQRWVSWYTL